MVAERLTLTQAVDLAIDAIACRAAKSETMDHNALSIQAVRSSIDLLKMKDLGTRLPGFESSDD